MEDGKYLLSAGVHNKDEWFVDHTKEDNSEWIYQMGGEVNFTAFQVKVDDEFRDTSDRSDSELTQRIKRYENRLRGLVTIPFGRFVGHGEVVYEPSQIQKLIFKIVRTPEESVSVNESYYTRNETSLRYRRQIAEKWYASLVGAMGLNQYTSHRTDFLWEPGAG